MIRAKSNLLDVAAQVASTFVGRSCYLLLQIFIARALGPRGFGLYAIGWTIVGLVSAIAPLGMPQAVIRFEFEGRRLFRSLPFVLAVIAGSGCCGLLILIASPLANVVFKEPGAAPAIVALAPSIPLLCIFNVLSAALRSSGRNVAAASVGALVFIIYLAATFLAFQEPAYRIPADAGWTYEIAVLLTDIALISLCWAAKGRKADIAVKRLISFGLVTMVIHTGSILNLQADRLLIGVLSDARNIGLYQVASQFAMIALVFRSAVQSVFEARVPKTDAAGAVTREFAASSRFLLHLCAPGLLCLAINAEGWTVHLFGTDYAGAAAPMAILVLGQLAQLFAGPSLSALHMTGGERMAMRITLASVAINVIGNLALIPTFGLLGSAFATGMAANISAFAALLRLRALGRVKTISAGLADITVGLAIATIPPTAARCFGLSSLLALIPMVVVSYLFYGLAVMRLKTVEDEVFEYIDAIGRRIFGVFTGGPSKTIAASRPSELNGAHESGVPLPGHHPKNGECIFRSEPVPKVVAMGGGS